MRIYQINSSRFTGYKYSSTRAQSGILTQDNIKKIHLISFMGNKSEVIKYKIDWGWSNFNFMDENFDAYFPKTEKLNITEGSEGHLQNVAEALCMYSDRDIENFTTVFYPFGTEINNKKSFQSYRKILPYIEQARERLLKFMEIRDSLLSKGTKYEFSELEDSTYKMVLGEIERIDKKCANAKAEYLEKVHYEVNDEPYNESVIY